MKQQLFHSLILGLILSSSFTCSISRSVFHSSWPESTQRYWIGPDYWANRLQDW
jgi:hypothetical protein